MKGLQCSLEVVLIKSFKRLVVVHYICPLLHSLVPKVSAHRRLDRNSNVSIMLYLHISIDTNVNTEEIGL